MRPSRHSAALAVIGLAVAAGCAAAPAQIGIDYDRATQFGRFCTYAWLEVPPDPNPAPDHPVLDDNTLLEARLHAAVDRGLQDKGLRLVEAESAELTVHYHAVIDERKQVISSTDYEVYGGVETVATQRTDVIEYTQGTLIIDIHEASSKHLVWRAVARESVDHLIGDPEAAHAAMGRTAGKMIARFPPGGSPCAAGES